MNTLDLIVVGVVVASALLAFFRGFLREVLAIGAWIGAVAVAYYLNIPARGFFRSLISATWIADLVCPVVLFVVSLVIFSLITGFLTSQVRSSQLSAVDRALGLGFGAVRGALVVCLAYLVLNYFIAPADRPPWIAEARTLPLLDMGSHELLALVPPDIVKRGGKTAQDVLQKAQAAQQMGQALNTLSAQPPQTPPPAQPTSNGPANSPQQSANAPSTPPAYSDKMSDQMNQAVQAIQNKP